MTLLETARRVGKVAEECKLPIDVEDYVGSFRPDLMDVMAAWYRGAKFADVLKMTEIFEVRESMDVVTICLCAMINARNEGSCSINVQSDTLCHAIHW